MNKKLALVIPCFNEAARLQKHRFLKFIEENPYVDFWFVNDGSTDNTIGILTEMQAALPHRIYVYSLPQNSGKAEAVRQGLMHVAQQDAYHYVGFIDADLSAPLQEVNLVFEAFLSDSNILVAVGARVKIVGSVIERSAMRHYLSRVFVTFYSTLLHLPNYDTQCGLKLFEKECAKIIFNRPFVSKWMFDTELFLRAMISMNKAGYTQQVREVPLNEWKEVGGSKLKMMDFIKAPFEILKIKRTYSKSLSEIKK